MSITTTTSWPNDWNVDPDAFRSIAENMAALTAKVGDFQQLFYQTYAQHRQELPHLLTLMIAHSWYPDFEIPIADSRALEARAIAGDFPAVEHYLIEYFRRNASILERRISDLYPDRAIVISTAFKAYSDGQYILAIPVFLAQADGVSKELLSKYFFKTDYWTTIPTCSSPPWLNSVQFGKIREILSVSPTALTATLFCTV